MPAPQQVLGKRIRHLREQRGWTQEDLGRKARKHPTYIGGIERGERNATVQVLADISKALGISIADLFTGDSGQ
ncbi:MAG: helix-turn-helix transcriptional regulator [Deltaproteobacteria bacterium]|nr:helix-turn-helix transcriptional regulator [Deltaproteobacteria bacterium]